MADGATRRTTTSVTASEYPAVLLTTAEGDSRVDPLHARKMAARLQAASADQGERPILLHQDGRVGHGVGKPVGKRADEEADALAFFAWQLGHDAVVRPDATRFAEGAG